MNNILFLSLGILGLVFLAVALLFVATIPLYIWLILRTNKLNKLAKDFNLSVESEMPSFWELNFLFGKREYTLANLEGEVNGHAVNIKEIWVNALVGEDVFGSSNNLVNKITIDGVETNLSYFKYPSVRYIRKYINNLSSHIVN